MPRKKMFKGCVRHFDKYYNIENYQNINNNDN